MGMTIALALKEIKIIDDKVEKRVERIEKLASGLSYVVPELKTVEAQQEKVMSLVQSVDDLVKRKALLRKKIQKANLETNVEFGGKSYTLADILFLKERSKKSRYSGFDTMKRVVDAIKQSVETQEAIAERQPKEKEAQVVRYFDTQWLEDRNEYLYSLMQNLDYLIEEANIRTEIDAEPYSEKE